MKMNPSNRMLKINQFISKYLLYAFPIIIITIVWNFFAKGHDPNILLWDILGVHFMIWFALLVYFLITLVVSATFRERILTRVTFSKERDERETFISGRASKTTFLSTLAVLILLFFLSGLNIHIYKKSKEEAVSGKRGTVSIGYSLKLIDHENNIGIKKDGTIIQMNGIPITKEGMILFIIVYHIASYLYTRRCLN